MICFDFCLSASPSALVHRQNDALDAEQNQAVVSHSDSCEAPPTPSSLRHDTPFSWFLHRQNSAKRHGLLLQDFCLIISSFYDGSASNSPLFWSALRRPFLRPCGGVYSSSLASGQYQRPEQLALALDR